MIRNYCRLYSSSMKAIIVLQARCSQGKTQTLFALRRILSPSPNIEEIIYENKNDFQSIITLENGCRVGIRSCGDPGNFRLTDLEKFQNCDFIFCAARTSGESCRIVQTYANNQEYDVIWTKPYSTRTDALQDLLNERRAEELKGLLTEFLKAE